AGMSTLRTRSVRRAVIEILEGHGARRRIDRVRTVALRLDNNEPAEADTLLGAAVLARCAHDHATVARFARAAHEVDPSLVSARLLGEALYELGRQQDALDVLTAASGMPGSPDDRFELGFARANTLFWGLSRHDEALDALRALADDPALAHRRVDVERPPAVLAPYLRRVAHAPPALASGPPLPRAPTAPNGSPAANCRPPNPPTRAPPPAPPT